MYAMTMSISSYLNNYWKHSRRSIRDGNKIIIRTAHYWNPLLYCFQISAIRIPSLESDQTPWSEGVWIA